MSVDDIGHKRRRSSDANASKHLQRNRVYMLAELILPEWGIKCFVGPQR